MFSIAGIKEKTINKKEDINLHDKSSRAVRSRSNMATGTAREGDSHDWQSERGLKENSLVERFKAGAGLSQILHQIPVGFLELPQHVPVVKSKPTSQSYPPQHTNQNRHSPRPLPAEPDHWQLPPPQWDALARHSPVRVEESHVLVEKFMI